MRDSYSFFNSLLKIQKVAVEILEDNQFPESLPPDAFVFYMHRYYCFFVVFKTSEGNNPPIYIYQEGETILTFKEAVSNQHSALSSKCVRRGFQPRLNLPVYRNRGFQPKLKKLIAEC